MPSGQSPGLLWIAPYWRMPQLGWQSGDALHLWPSCWQHHSWCHDPTGEEIVENCVLSDHIIKSTCHAACSVYHVSEQMCQGEIIDWNMFCCSRLCQLDSAALVPVTRSAAEQQCTEVHLCCVSTSCLFKGARANFDNGPWRRRSRQLFNCWKMQFRIFYLDHNLGVLFRKDKQEIWRKNFNKCFKTEKKEMQGLDFEVRLQYSWQCNIRWAWAQAS